MCDPWYKARNILLGIDWQIKSTKDALEVAKTSNHPDAQWFCSLGKSVDLHQVNDPRARLYTLISEGVYEPLRNSPYLFGRLLYVLHGSRVVLTPDHPIVKEVETTKTDDPYLLCMIANVFLQTSWYRLPEYRVRAINLYKAAADMGCNEAIRRYHSELSKTRDSSFKWFGKIVKNTRNTNYDMFLQTPIGTITNSGRYLIGKVFWNRPDLRDPTIVISRTLYATNSVRTRDAVHCWLLCANRLNRENQRILLNRDIRRKIGILIWKSRKEGLFRPF